MTNAEVPDETLGHAEIERLLSAVVDDHATTFPNRAGLRREMLEQFERSDLGASPSPDSSDRSKVGSGAIDEPMSEVIELVGTSRLPRRSWRPQLAAAIVVLLVSVSVLGLSLMQGGNDSTIDATSDQTRLVPEGATLPAAVEEGEHRTMVVGGGIRFELPQGIEVVEERPGRVVLGRQDDLADPRAAVTVATHDGGGSLGVLVAELEEQGFVTLIESVVMADQKLVTDWEVRVTSEGSSHFGCDSVGPCVSLGPIELWSRGVNYVAEITGSDGQSIWWVEQSGVHQDPFLQDAVEILATLRFE